MSTMSTTPNFQQDCWPGGQMTFKVQWDTFLNSGQQSPTSGVQIEITAATGSTAGSGTPVPTTSSGVTAIAGNQALYQYVWNVPASTVPGDYMVVWTGTRISDSTAVSLSQVVTVAAIPSQVPAPGVYASVAQYQARTGDVLTPTAIIQNRLVLASEDIDRAIIGAVYATDATGMPLDAGLADILMRATIEQCRFLNVQDDDTGIKREFSSITTGGVSTTRTAAMQGPSLPVLAPRALQLLHTYGVLPVAVLVNW